MNESDATLLSSGGAGGEHLAHESAGSNIGHYKLLQQIGEGGFGAVWMAEQKEPVKRRVALKIIKLGMDTRQVVARFEAERQALAMMDHPNIAKVLDAGATDTGRPYFVMELVRGIPITQYCDENNVSTEERLNLFIQVCHAIQHAHQKGIIHRDIKPSNILVTLHDGLPVPKVIDFGIAKATQHELTEKTLFTQFQQFIGTPVYMSPEQAEMSGLDIDTRSDIYSLGVLLYELLTGRTPFDSKELTAAGVDEMRRMIREQEPVRPSTRLSSLAAEELTTTAKRRHTDVPALIHQLKGDLDWVAMKCLEKDRTRRYETANGLAMDVQRFQRHEPVTARPPSQAYRLQKWVRRNKVMAAAVLSVTAALVFGLALSAWMFLRERDARERAVAAEKEQARQRAEAETARKAETVLRERAERGEKAAAENARALQSSIEDARLNLYVASMNIAERALRDNDLRRAVEHLDKLKPAAGEEDLRGFEWYYLRDQCRTHDRFTIREPSGMVQAIDVSADGQYLAAANVDKSVKIWDLRTKEVKLHLTHPKASRFFSLKFSPDGRKLAAGGRGDGPAVFVWDAQAGEVLISPSDITARGPVAFSHDGTLLIARKVGSSRSSTPERGFQVWRLKDKQPLVVLQDERAAPWAVVAHRSRPMYAASYGSGALQIWEGHPPQLIDTLLAHSPVFGAGMLENSLAISDDGKLLATSGGDESLQLWNIAERRRLFELTQGEGSIWAVDLSPDGKTLASGHADSSLQIWDTATGQKVATLRGHVNEVFGVKFLPDSKSLVSCGKDHAIKFWNLDSLPATPIVSSDGPIHSVTFSDDGTYVAVLGRNGIEIRQASDFSRIRKISAPGGYGTVLRGGRHLVAYLTSPQTVQVWDPFADKLIREFSARNEFQFRATLLADEKWVAILDGLLARIYEVKTGNLIWEQGLPDLGESCAYLQASDQLIVGYGLGKVDIWNLREKKKIASLPGHYDHVLNMAITSGEKELVTAAMDGAIKIWRTSDWKLLHDVHGHTGIIWALALSPDGRTLASAGTDKKIRLWNTRNWRLVQTLDFDVGAAPLCFSPKGDALASAAGRMLRVWRAPLDERRQVRTHE